eukprot:TRINITY_DN10954_c0_g1_i2.p1 TRINITY_DN10954_c0_g1~~TRINITY_DN10954_c0_g1_i2.p1  ORF type:complete len:383 (+),score=76.05 TRINITY_DN10954_c0_g1_i2:695-1843(+)
MRQAITRKHWIILCVSIVVMSFLPVFFFLDRKEGSEQQLPHSSDMTCEDEYASQIANLSQQLDRLKLELHACKNGSEGSECAQRPSAGESKKPWLMISIPTVRRRDAPTYLYTVLEAFIEELSSMYNLGALHDTVRFFIMDNTVPQIEDDTVFCDELERTVLQMFTEHRLEDLLIYERSTGEIHKDHVGENDKGDPNVPGARVRRQTRDLSNLIRKASKLGQHVLLTEDDFLPCPFYLRTMFYLMDKLHCMDENWSGLRVSYGSNGYLFKSSDVVATSDYMLKRISARPPDHILVEWMSKESEVAKLYFGDRRLYTFRYLVSQHIGVKSSLRTEKHDLSLECFRDNKKLFRVESFDLENCEHEDVSPCDRICPAFPQPIKFH